MTTNPVAASVRSYGVIEDECRRVLNTLLEELNSCQDGSQDEAEQLRSTINFAGKVAELMPARIEHNSETHIDFYNDLMEMMMQSIQEPSDDNLIISLALSYTKEIRFFGHDPVFTFLSLFGGGISDVQPVFDVIVQHDKVFPIPTTALRFSVTKGGDIKWRILDVSGLQIKPLRKVDIQPLPVVKSKTVKSKAKAKPGKLTKVASSTKKAKKTAGKAL